MIDFCSLRHLLLDIQKLEDAIEKKYHLTFMQASVLCALDHHFEDGKSIACQMGISPSRMTRLLDVLEGKGLVMRSSSTVDRRNNIVTLTPEGEKYLAVIKTTDIPIPAYIREILKGGMDT